MASVQSRLFVWALAAAALVSTGRAMAQSTPYYITDGDARAIYIIQNGTLQSTVTGIANNFSAPAIRSTIWLATVPGDASAEYTLAGLPTGANFTLPGTYQQLLDGTCDGASFNYAGQWNSDEPNVIRADPDWRNQTILFSLANGTEITGIAYDPTTTHLFLAVETDNTIREYTLAGSLVNSFNLSNDFSGLRPCCLAYEAATDTLWLAANSTSNIWQYSKAGTQLHALTITGLGAQGNGNIWGGEMAPTIPASAIPVLGGLGVAALILLLAVGGYVLARRA